jgi:serine/threonine protein kinase
MTKTHRIANIGDTLNGRYVIDDVIGSGGQGIIFKAYEISANTPVAIKQLISDEQSPQHASAVARFKRTSKIHIPHPQAINAIDFFEQDGLYAVYPWIEGHDLSQSSLPVDPREAVRIIRDLAGLLHSVHEQGIIHRDIKLSNIIMDGAGMPHLCDFGISRIAGVDTLTPENTVIGSLHTIPPEQLRYAHVDERADVAALGMVFSQLLTDKPPRSGMNDDDLKHQALHEIPVPPSTTVPGLPVQLDAICRTMYAPDPDDRYQTAREVIDALDAFTTDSVSGNLMRCLACGARLEHAWQSKASPRPYMRPYTCPGCDRMFPSHKVQLRCSGQMTETKGYLIPEGQYVVGRDQIAPDDLQISRMQFALSCSSEHPPGIAIRNAGKNPTTIDGVIPSSTTTAHDGQRISMPGRDFVLQSSP